MRELRNSDHHAEAKHREAVFGRLRGELMRESGNQASFTRVKAKVLAERDVMRDPTLRSMLMAFIGEREASFRMTHNVRPKLQAKGGTSRARMYSLSRTPEAAAGEARVRARMFDERFNTCVNHFREAEAEFILVRIRSIAKDFPTVIDGDRLAEYEAILKRMKKRRVDFYQHIDEVVERAVAAAMTGNHDAATRALRRLSSIHALHPDLLADARFSTVRDRIMNAGEQAGQGTAVQRLLDRERAVASELKRLSAKMREYYVLSRSVTHEDESYRKAEAEFLATVSDVARHDTEWYSHLLLELSDLLRQIHDPPPEKARAQVDQFMAGVQKALATLRREATAAAQPVVTPSPQGK